MFLGILRSRIELLEPNCGDMKLTEPLPLFGIWQFVRNFGQASLERVDGPGDGADAYCPRDYENQK